MEQSKSSQYFEDERPPHLKQKSGKHVQVRNLASPKFRFFCVPNQKEILKIKTKSD